MTLKYGRPGMYGLNVVVDGRTGRFLKLCQSTDQSVPAIATPSDQGLPSMKEGPHA
jgi:hypothetical protein